MCMYVASSKAIRVSTSRKKKIIITSSSSIATLGGALRIKLVVK